MFSIFKKEKDPNKINITSKSQSKNEQSFTFEYKNKTYKYVFNKISNEEYEINLREYYNYHSNPNIYFEKKATKLDMYDLDCKGIQIGNLQLLRIKNTDYFDEDFFNEMQKIGLINKDYKFNELSIYNPVKYYSENFQEYDNINLIKTNSFENKNDSNYCSTVDSYYFKFKGNDYYLEHQNNYQIGVERNYFKLIQRVEDPYSEHYDYMEIKETEFNESRLKQYYLSLTDNIYDNECGKELVDIINKNFNQNFNFYIKDLIFRNNEMKLNVCGEEYVVNKTNDELKFYNIGKKFQSSANQYVDYKKEIYSYKKENIVGTEIEIRKYDPEYFDEMLFNPLQSREDIKEFLGFDYKDYNDFKSKAEIVNEQKEQNKNELER